VIEKATKQVEELGEQLEREFAETHPPPPPKQQPRTQQPTTEELLSPDVAVVDSSPAPTSVVQIPADSQYIEQRAHNADQDTLRIL
jgi:hypothetical protein